MMKQIPTMGNRMSNAMATKWDLSKNSRVKSIRILTTKKSDQKNAQAFTRRYPYADIIMFVHISNLVLIIRPGR